MWVNAGFVGQEMQCGQGPRGGKFPVAGKSAMSVPADWNIVRVADDVNPELGMVLEQIRNFFHHRFASRFQDGFTGIEHDSIQNVDRELSLQLGDGDILGFEVGPHFSFQPSGLLRYQRSLLFQFGQLLFEFGDLVLFLLTFGDSIREIGDCVPQLGLERVDHLPMVPGRRPEPTGNNDQQRRDYDGDPAQPFVGALRFGDVFGERLIALGHLACLIRSAELKPSELNFHSFLPEKDRNGDLAETAMI